MHTLVIILTVWLALDALFVPVWAILRRPNAVQSGQHPSHGIMQGDFVGQLHGSAK